MAGYPREALLIALIMSIIFSSLFLGIVNYTYVYGSLPDLSGGTTPPGMLGIGISGAAIPTTNSQDYTSPTGYDLNITQSDIGLSIGPKWTQGATGYVCTEIPFFPLYQPAFLYMIDVVPNSAGEYDVTYSIDNIPGEPFYMSIYSVGQDNGLFVNADADGFHLQTLGVLGFSNDVVTMIQSPGADITVGTSTYQTKYNPSTQTVTIIKDSQDIGTFYNVPPVGVGSDYPGIAYGGVATYSTGFTISQALGIFTTVAAKAAASNLDFLSMLAAILGFTSSPLIPAWMFASIFFPQLAGILYMSIELVRGT